MSVAQPPDTPATGRSLDDIVVSNPSILAGRRVFRGTPRRVVHAIVGGEPVSRELPAVAPFKMR